MQVENYHKPSEKIEDEFYLELLALLTPLLLSLQELKPLTKEKIHAEIAGWLVLNAAAINRLNEEQIVKIKTIVDDIFNDDLVTDLQVKKYTDANNDLVNNIITDIRTKYEELSTISHNYPLNINVKQDYVQNINNFVDDKTKLFAVMSTISNMRALLFESAALVGFTEYRWRTQRDNKVRPSHAYMEGKWVRFDSPPSETGYYHVGEDWNCFPGETLIQFADKIDCAMRRVYTGKAVTLTTKSGNILKSTLNHPILTNRGWVLANDLKIGDYLVEIIDSERIKSNSNVNNTIPSISNIFNSIKIHAFRRRRVHFVGSGKSYLNFHGEVVVKKEVDIVFPDGELSFNAIKNIRAKRNKFFFTSSNNYSFPIFYCISFFKLFFSIFNSSKRIIGFNCNIFSFFKRKVFKSNNVGFTTIPNDDISFSESINNTSSRYIVFFRKKKSAFPRNIFINNILWTRFRFSKFNIFFFNNSSSYSYREIQRVRDALSTHSIDIKFTRLIDKFITDFDGHVYNLQTEKEFYIANNIVTHNCRCYALEFR